MSTGNVDLQIAIADLNASRARLREVLVPPPADPNAPKSKGLFSGISDSVTSLWNSFTGGKSGTGTGSTSGTSGTAGMGASTALLLAWDAVQSWWASHPWRQIGNTVAAPLGIAALPLVRRNPWAAVAIASVAGALFIKTRPWRWRLVAHQAHVVRRQAVRWALVQATKPAVQALVATAIASMMSSLNQKKSSAAAATVDGAAVTPAAAVPPAPHHGPQ